MKLSQCVVCSCTCNAKTPSKEEPKSVKNEDKPSQQKRQEEPKLPQEQKTDSVPQKVFTPVVEVKSLKESPQELPKEAPKEQRISTQNTFQKPLPVEIKTPTPKVQAPKANGQEYMQTNLSAIIAMLHENFYYPLSARKRGIQGEVVVKFTLCKNKEIKDIKILKSAPEILSKAAINTIESLSGKLPAPAEELVLELPINYKLH